MRSIDYNLSLLEIMLEDFESYILSSVLFWPLSAKRKGMTPLPRFTLGGMCLTLDELTVQREEMSREQERTYNQLIRTYERHLSKWHVGISKKAQKELGARINLWRAYLNDLEDDPENIEYYHREVRIRVMIHHLIGLCQSNPDMDELIELVSYLDNRFEDYLKSNAFLWDERLTDVYPREKFAFLYKCPRR